MVPPSNKIFVNGTVSIQIAKGSLFFKNHIQSHQEHQQADRRAGAYVQNHHLLRRCFPLEGDQHGALHRHQRREGACQGDVADGARQGRAALVGLHGVDDGHRHLPEGVDGNDQHDDDGGQDAGQHDVAHLGHLARAVDLGGFIAGGRNGDDRREVHDGIVARALPDTGDLVDRTEEIRVVQQTGLGGLGADEAQRLQRLADDAVARGQCALLDQHRHQRGHDDGGHELGQIGQHLAGGAHDV